MSRHQTILITMGRESKWIVLGRKNNAVYFDELERKEWLNEEDSFDVRTEEEVLKMIERYPTIRNLFLDVEDSFFGPGQYTPAMVASLTSKLEGRFDLVSIPQPYDLFDHEKEHLFECIKKLSKNIEVEEF